MATKINVKESSIKGTLNVDELKSIGKGALIALSGAVLIILSESINLIDFGSATPIAVAVASILVNAGRKLWNGRN
jgi:hypothetical protein